MGGLGATLRGVILESLGFDQQRNALATVDLNSSGIPSLSPSTGTGTRRVALWVAATLIDNNGQNFQLVTPGDTSGNVRGVATIGENELYDPVPNQWGRQRGVSAARALSAVNTANQQVLDTLGLSQVLDIVMTASAGTATLLVEVSVDNVNWLTVDTIAAAAATTKHYNNTTVGATTLVTPIAFRFLRVTAGAAGVGNTTTVTVSAK